MARRVLALVRRRRRAWAVSMKVEVPVAGDAAEIRALLDGAFAPSTFESSLVLALRKSRREMLEWIIRSDSRVVAHIAFTRAYRGSSPIGFHLAPVAVLPALQRKGFGTELISQALQHPRLALVPVFVLGDPQYYVRFGFRRITRPICPFEPTNEHFQALRWESSEMFTIGYEPEFKAA